jgi:hypothetical protein
MDPNWPALAAAIKKQRRVLRYSQEALADAADLSRSTIQKLEWATAENIERDTVVKLEHGLRWAPGSVDAVLNGGVPTVIISPDGAYPPAQDPYQPLSERLPVSVLDELSSGEVYAAEIHDLTVDGGMRIITVAIRHPNEPAQQGPNAETRRRNQRAWSRMQRQIKGLEPLPWEPGDPEEWKRD